MAYDRLNLKTGDELNEAVFKRIDDGISNSIQVEEELAIETTKNMLNKSNDYWLLGLNSGITISQQAFMNGDDESDLTVPILTPNTTVNYVCSPIIRLDTEASNVLKINNTARNIRHLTGYNSKGQTLFSFGYGAAQFTGALTSSALSNFAKNADNQSLYPHICSDFKFNNFSFSGDVVKELNKLYTNETSATVEYVSGEPVWIIFNLTTTTRPALEEDWGSWLHTNIRDITLVSNKTVTTKVLPSIAINPTVAKKYFEYPMLDNVMSEIGEFKKALSIKNQVLHTSKSTVVYSKTMVDDFLPNSLMNTYLQSNTTITDFNTPTYTNLRDYVVSDSYMTCRPIPIDLSEGNSYEVSGEMRFCAFFDVSGLPILFLSDATNLKFDAEYFETRYKDPNEVKWMAVSNMTSRWNRNWKLTLTKEKSYYSFEMPSLLLTEEQLGGVDLSGVGDGYKSVNLSNVDRIVAIGDSYTESHATIKDKSWLSKTSLLTDYNYDNFALSGDTYRGQLNKIRTGYFPYTTVEGMSWEMLNPTHAILMCKTNDAKYMDSQQYIYDMVATIETTKGLGAIPIVATEYHVNNDDYMQTAFDYYAKKYGGYFVDLTEKAYTFRGKDYAPFWLGSHPGTRTNHLLCDVMTNYINKNLPRPYSSIKIFRARDTSLISNLDNYLFGTVEERAEKFKEISVGHAALINSYEYDNCTSAKYNKVNSEYHQLMSGNAVAFENVCLIDVILPSTVRDITEIKLITNEMNGVNCYVKDIIAEPYPSPAFCRRFDIPTLLDSSMVAVGNTYSSSAGGSATYKVVEILYDKVESDNGFVDGTILICSGNSSTSAYTNTTLTLKSGSGNSTLSCSYEAVGLSSDYPQGKQDNGHYVLLEEYGVVQGSVLKRAVDNDKITFLLVGDGSFNLRSVEVKFKGNITKQRDVATYHNILPKIGLNPQSFITTTKFDTDSISKWLKLNKTACGLTPHVPADNNMPTNISQIVTLTPDDGTIIQSISNGNVSGATNTVARKVRVWARYFPDIFDHTTMTYPDESIINDNSFDYAKLAIKLYGSSADINNDDTVDLNSLVGLHWTEVELDFLMPPANKTWYLGLKAVDKPIQLAYCDVI